MVGVLFTGAGICPYAWTHSGAEGFSGVPDTEAMERALTIPGRERILVLPSINTLLIIFHFLPQEIRFIFVQEKT